VEKTIATARTHFRSRHAKSVLLPVRAALTVEADQLRRVVRDNNVDYAIYDSIAFACDGRPEDAEVAGRYFRAVREIGCGSLHIAHVNRSEDNE
jgi:hypothetical protein